MNSKELPHLGTKLTWLFKNHVIRNQSQLAAKISCSPAQISRWVTGVDKISYKRIQSLCDLFLMPEKFFLEENITRAKSMLHSTNQANSWQQLVELKTDPDALSIHDVDEPLRAQPLRRSLEDDDGLDHIPRDGRIRIHLTAQPSWFVLLLMRDAEGAYCLTPTLDDSNHRIAENRDQFLLPTDNDYLELQSPRGLGSVIAVVCSIDWDENLLNGLQTDDQEVFYRGVNRLTSDLQKAQPGTWKVLEKSFRLI